MLEDHNHIDKLLQKGMENFEPIAPEGVWENIAQQLPSAAGAGASGNSLFQAIQKVSMGLKLGVVLGLSVSIGIIYVVISKKEVPQMAAKVLVQEIPMNQEREESVAIENASEKEAQQDKIKGSKIASQKTIAAQTQVISKEPSAPVLVNPIIELPNSTNGVAKESKAQEKLVAPVSIIKHHKIEKAIENLNAVIEPEYGNAFSPDGDGKNDTWEIRLENPGYFHLKIMDASGQLVFETEQYGQFWNGINQRNGLECEAGTYAFVIDYQASNSEKIKTKNGILNLYR